MAKPDQHTQQDAPFEVPRQAVRLHIWGLLSQDWLDELLPTLRQLFSMLEHPVDFPQAMSPGGTLIRNMPWGQMPDGLAGVLKNYHLHLVWRSASTPEIARNSCVTHADLETMIRFAGSPDHQEITSAKNISAPGNDPYMPARLLLRLGCTFGVQRSISAHETVLSSPALRAACQARSFEDLAAAVAMLPRETKT